MRRFLTIFTILAAISAGGLTFGTPALAVEPNEVLADPVLEARARELSKVLRCVVCQNQSIDDSNADIARDMRVLVRERLVAGDTDDQTVAHMVARYGDYVLLRPPFQTNTLALWIGPPLMAFVVAALGLLFFRMYQRVRAASQEPEPLTPTDRAQLDALVEKLAAQPRPPRRQSELRTGFQQPYANPGRPGSSGSDNPAT